MLDANPNEIQTQPSHLPPVTPLVLIHDGGGTTFGYFSLGSLERTVWAIHNPNFMTGKPWAGGIDAMAAAYVQLLREAGVRGEVILGGWSLGGWLALAMAKLLAKKEEISKADAIFVKSLLIIDSPYHTPGRKQDFDNLGLPPLPELVRKSFDQSGNMMKIWELPSWDGVQAQSGRELLVDGLVVKPGEVLNVDVLGKAKVESVPKYEEDGGFPPWAVLVKATQTLKNTDAVIDRWRNEKVLGWEGRYPEFVKAVVEVDSHHFAMFSLSTIDYITEKINRALEILDRGTVKVAGKTGL
ncbi:thioesterase domain-containing protein [Phlyctema vagabunda]|uniref:Thioesterase domain-containing protein n=1 Tax=Phlyctema vagabunda TaxID=108571 RepID=A0ABR4P9L4_9HELO